MNKRLKEKVKNSIMNIKLVMILGLIIISLSSLSIAINSNINENGDLIVIDVSDFKRVIEQNDSISVYFSVKYNSNATSFIRSSFVYLHKNESYFWIMKVYNWNASHQNMFLNTPFFHIASGDWYLNFTVIENDFSNSSINTAIRLEYFTVIPSIITNTETVTNTVTNTETVINTETIINNITNTVTNTDTVTITTNIFIISVLLALIVIVFRRKKIDGDEN